MHWLGQYIGFGWLWWSVATVYALTILGIIAVVVSENRNPVKSLAWVTVLLVVPMVGLILYIFFGRNIQNKRIISRRNRRILRRLTNRSGASARQGKPPEHIRNRINLASSLCGSNYYEGNKVDIFDNGADKIEALLADIRNARRYINLQYYILIDDKVGRRVIEALEERARAGVKVRVIYDHVGSFRLSRKALEGMRRAGWRPFRFSKWYFRRSEPVSTGATTARL